MFFLNRPNKSAFSDDVPPAPNDGDLPPPNTNQQPPPTTNTNRAPNGSVSRGIFRDANSAAGHHRKSPPISN
ncbi:hypothetical protein NLJ89_g5558 [Agrocybe chaxingu]|uniref:Uncharacterized protein n=1 Tax=Agrocybe chaxingu TaxID=84603 RepID=A0A9W8MWU1_9AGAR|nr:hypothetical protein NLJ89_g5558 [Agrocybe chaxingu]